VDSAQRPFIFLAPSSLRCIDNAANDWHSSDCKTAAVGVTIRCTAKEKRKLAVDVLLAEIRHPHCDRPPLKAIKQRSYRMWPLRSSIGRRCAGRGLVRVLALPATRGVCTRSCGQMKLITPVRRSFQIAQKSSPISAPRRHPSRAGGKTRQWPSAVRVGFRYLSISANFGIDL
jgi:hypothetical protein